VFVTELAIEKNDITYIKNGEPSRGSVVGTCSTTNCIGLNPPPGHEAPPGDYWSGHEGDQPGGGPGDYGGGGCGLYGNDLYCDGEPGLGDYWGGDNGNGHGTGYGGKAGGRFGGGPGGEYNGGPRGLGVKRYPRDHN